MPECTYHITCYFLDRICQPSRAEADAETISRPKSPRRPWRRRHHLHLSANALAVIGELRVRRVKHQQPSDNDAGAPLHHRLHLRRPRLREAAVLPVAPPPRAHRVAAVQVVQAARQPLLAVILSPSRKVILPFINHIKTLNVLHLDALR